METGLLIIVFLVTGILVDRLAFAIGVDQDATNVISSVAAGTAAAATVIIRGRRKAKARP